MGDFHIDTPKSPSRARSNSIVASLIKQGSGASRTGDMKKVLE